LCQQQGTTVLAKPPSTMQIPCKPKMTPMVWFSLKSIMTTLTNAPIVIPQLIKILFAVSNASIYAPCMSMLSRMPVIVSINKNNNCKIVIDNCAPYDVAINFNYVIGLIDIETNQLIPQED
jgi:hypothetical protein